MRTKQLIYGREWEEEEEAKCTKTFEKDISYDALGKREGDLVYCAYCLG